METKNLKVGLLFWDKDKQCPIIISYINVANNCIRWISFSDNRDSENIPLIKKGKKNNRLSDLEPTNEDRILAYLSVRVSKVYDKINTSLSKLNETQRQHANHINELINELALADLTKKIIKKFNEKLTKN